MFNPCNVQRLNEMSENVKGYEDTLNKLRALLESKVEEEKSLFQALIFNTNTFDYFLKLLKKDSTSYKIKQLEHIIETQTKDLKQEKEYLRRALEQINKGKKAGEDIPTPSTGDLFMS